MDVKQEIKSHTFAPINIQQSRKIDSNSFYELMFCHLTHNIYQYIVQKILAITNPLKVFALLAKLVETRVDQT